MNLHQTIEPYDVEAIRAEFPILAREVYGKPLVYLDNAASAQKPRAVIDAMVRTMETGYANVHRGLHFMANAATEAFEEARESVRAFLNAGSVEEIVFTKSATEAINLVAASFGRLAIREGDEVVLSIMEHHSNIVPWHFLRERQGAVLKWAPVDDQGEFLIEEFEKLLSPRTKIVAITHMSNVLGTVTPIREIVRIAHARGIPVLVDGSQGAVHLDVDVRDMMALGRDRIRAHEHALSAYAHERLRAMNSLRIIGDARDKGAIISFEMKGAHAHDVATVVDRQGVAVRAGTHCAMPLLERFGATSTCRASFGLYNTMAEVDKLAEALQKAETLFG